jgi:hypothetical protein
MRGLAQLFFVILIALSVVFYLGYDIAMLFTHQTLLQALMPMLLGAVVLSAVIWGLHQIIKSLKSPSPPI